MCSPQCLRQEQNRERPEQKDAHSTQPDVDERHHQSHQKKYRGHAAAQFWQFVMKHLACVQQQLLRAIVPHRVAEGRCHSRDSCSIRTEKQNNPRNATTSRMGEIPDTLNRQNKSVPARINAEVQATYASNSRRASRKTSTIATTKRT